MATTIENADLETICKALAENRTVDPAVLKRVRDRADLIRDELAKKGLTDLAVQLIRETRDE